MAEVEAQALPTASGKESSNRELYATVAYHYPQYTLQDVSKLKYRDVVLLLRTAEKINAEKFLTLTHIVTAPHTKKGEGVKNLLKPRTCLLYILHQADLMAARIEFEQEWKGKFSKENLERIS